MAESDDLYPGARVPGVFPDVVRDAHDAVWDVNRARSLLVTAASGGAGPVGVLLTDVWVFDPTLTQVLLVDHRRRGWVMPGGHVERGETVRAAAVRELHEETGVRAGLFDTPAQVSVSDPKTSPNGHLHRTFSISYAAVIDTGTPTRPEPDHGSAVGWHPLSSTWTSVYPHDRERLARHARWLRDGQLRTAERAVSLPPTPSLR